MVLGSRLSVLRTAVRPENRELRTENQYDSPVSVDDLRWQLRERGYLSHGIERWFALDPWRSRAFWVELTIVAAKAAILIGAFALLPLVAIMLFAASWAEGYLPGRSAEITDALMGLLIGMIIAAVKTPAEGSRKGTA